MKKLIISSVAFAVALTAGCSTQSGAASGSPTTSSSASAAATGMAAAEAYFEGLASNDIAPMLANSTEGSPARAYAEMWRDRDDAYPNDSSSTSAVTGETITLTDSDGQTTVNSDLTYGPRGLLSTWTATPGGPLAPRINNTPKPFRVNPIDGTVLVQYVTNDSGLVIILDIRNTSGKETNLSPEHYVTPSGQQKSADISSGDTTGGAMTLQPKAQTKAMISVGKGAGSGGTLYLKTFDGKGLTQTEKAIKLP